MRDVKYGKFVDFMPPTYDGSGMIGARIYVRQAQEEALKTAKNEYYIQEGYREIIVKDANIIEKMRARFKHLIDIDKHKVVGSRESALNNPYNDPEPQLGVRINKDGKKEVDSSYYENRRARTEANDYLSKEEKEAIIEDANRKELQAAEDLNKDNNNEIEDMFEEVEITNQEEQMKKGK